MVLRPRRIRARGGVPVEHECGAGALDKGGPAARVRPEAALGRVLVLRPHDQCVVLHRHRAAELGPVDVGEAVDLRHRVLRGHESLLEAPRPAHGPGERVCGLLVSRAHHEEAIPHCHPGLVPEPRAAAVQPRLVVCVRRVVQPHWMRRPPRWADQLVGVDHVAVGGPNGEDAVGHCQRAPKLGPVVGGRRVQHLHQLPHPCHPAPHLHPPPLPAARARDHGRLLPVHRHRLAHLLTGQGVRRHQLIVRGLHPDPACAAPVSRPRSCPAAPRRHAPSPSSSIVSSPHSLPSGLGTMPGTDSRSCNTSSGASNALSFVTTRVWVALLPFPNRSHTVSAT